MGTMGNQQQQWGRAGAGFAWRHHRRLSLCSLALSLVLGACGGGGGGGSSPVDPGQNTGPQPLVDTNVYNASAAGSLATGSEASIATQHRITLDGQSLAYTARAGHLLPQDAQGRPQAAVFYVAYTLDGATPGQRPVTFFYNGGPGSASVWLHIGSFGPKRLATGMPDQSAARPYALVDNAESLLDSSDLVFINAVSTGYSQAVAPYTNASFWGVDSDARLFRDSVQRYLTLNQRSNSPVYLFGESYGGPRTAVLAAALEAAGTRLSGAIVLSPAMNYGSNCSMTGGNCSGFLPSMSAVGRHFGLVQKPLAGLPELMDGARLFATQSYLPAVQAVRLGAAIPPGMPAELTQWTGLASSEWQSSFNMQPYRFRDRLMPDKLLGRYDGRIAADKNSPLAAEGDPSSTLISDSFAQRVVEYLRNDLRFRNDSGYTVLSDAIQSWEFRHAERDLPDTIPDLGAAMTLNPRLRVLALNGYHDLATPFFVTEGDLGRLASQFSARLALRNYAGGHMIYLDDASRRQLRADLQAFYREQLPMGWKPSSAALSAQLLDRGPTLARAAALAAADFSDQAAGPLRDPWVPAQLRRAQQPASQGEALLLEQTERLKALHARSANSQSFDSWLRARQSAAQASPGVTQP